MKPNTTTTNITATVVITTMIFFSWIDFYLLLELIPMEISLSIQRNDVCNDLFSCFLCFDFLIIWVFLASDSASDKLCIMTSIDSYFCFTSLTFTSTSKHTTLATKSTKTITTNKTYQHHSLMLLTIYP